MQMQPISSEERERIAVRFGSVVPGAEWTRESGRLLKKRVNLPVLTHRQGLLPDWDGPGSAYPRAEPREMATAAGTVRLVS